MRYALVGLLALVIGGCGGTEAPGTAELGTASQEVIQCQQNSDCPTGHVCFATANGAAPHCVIPAPAGHPCGASYPPCAAPLQCCRAVGGTVCAQVPAGSTC